MNTRYLYIIGGLMMATVVGAQSLNNKEVRSLAEMAARMNQQDYEGTARSQAMGSAFGALGADLTSQSINPAGLAAYRATEFAAGFGVNVNKTKSEYNGYEDEDVKGSVPLHVLGLVLNIDRSAEKASGAVSHSFSISYSRLADYNRTAFYQDKNAYNSLLDYFATGWNDTNADNYDFETGLATDAGWLFGPYKDGGDEITFATNAWEQPYGCDNLDLAARVAEDELGEYGLVDHTQRVRERGYKGETSFGYGMNVSNIFYWGASMGIQSMSFKQEVTHKESYFGDPYKNAYEKFTYCTDLKQDGSGVNFNAGVIIKPIDMIRLGVAVHSPTFFSVNEKLNADMDGAYDDMVFYSREKNYEYRYRTPARVVVSVAAVAGSWALLSIDYERANGSKSKFKATIDGDDFDYYDDATDAVKEVMETQHTLRIGAEARPLNFLYLRAGYNVQSQPFKDSMHEYKYKHDALSCGVGFRKSNFFLDLAYVCRRSQTDRYVLPESTEYVYALNKAACGTSKSHNGMLTLGFRF